MFDRRDLLKAVPGVLGLSFLAEQTAAQENGPGSVIWTFDAGEGGLSGFILRDDTLYAAGYLDIYAVDIRDGTERWRFPTEGRGGRVASIGETNVYAVNGERFFANTYAIDAKSGALRWTIEANWISTLAPVESNGMVYAGKDEYQLCALDPLSGGEHWRFNLMNSPANSPIIDGDTLYIGSFASNLYALDAQTGADRWWFSAGERISTPEAVIDGVLYTGSSDANVYALDAATGAERWRFACEAEVTTPPTFANGSLYVKDFDFTVYALDAATGAERWRFPMGAQNQFADPVEYEGKVLVGSYDGNVYALDALTGAERWRFEGDGSIVSIVRVSAGTAYVIDYEYLYALDPDTGEVRWRVEPARSSLVIGEALYASGGGGVQALVPEPPHTAGARAGIVAVVLTETPLRAAPLTSGEVIETLDEGDEVEVTGEAVETGGVTWWPVMTADGKTGWVDGEALARS
jgi:outer membrane protein assembly factor BamB